MKNVIRIAIATITIGLGSSAVQAGHSSSSLVREAHRVVSYADQLTSEAKRHFRHTSQYRHLLNDAASIRREAKHIDELSHHVHGISDVRHLKADLEELDELVHHIGELIEDIEHGYGSGHTHGDTHHVEKLVANINRSIHSMQRTVRGLEHHYSRSHDDHRGSGREVRDTRRNVSTCGSSPSGEVIAGAVLREVLRRR
jgi:septation ring formation regulator EzrA